MSVIVRWFKHGGMNARLLKLTIVAGVWYWLIHFLSETLKMAEAATSFMAFFAYLLWLSHRKLQSIRRAGMDEIDEMSGTEFEQKLLVHFCGLGWKAQGTRVTGDFGADLVLTDPTGRKVVAQCKRYDDKVGLDAVQEVVASIRYYKADCAMVITNNYLTNAAKKLAFVNDVEVWERDKLAASLASVSNLGGSGIWTQFKLILERIKWGK